jgi:HEAT repeat protein
MRLGLLFQRGKVNAEIARVYALQKDGNVVGLIHMLDSDLRGLTQYSIVRDHAVTALGQLDDPRAIPYLIEMRHDPDKMVRMDVIRALRRQHTKEAEAAVCEGLKDSTPLVRMSAASALGHIGGGRCHPAALERSRLRSRPVRAS